MKTLQEGDIGPEVAELQAALGGVGFLPEGAYFWLAHGVGKFGPYTTKAVNRYRESLGWDPHGRATQNTQRALSGQVAALQRKLAALGRYRGEQHGRFDDATRAALAGFQSEHKLPASGRLDPETLDRLEATPPFTFDEVLACELHGVMAGRRELGQAERGDVPDAGNPVVRAHQARLLGLAFSGGGIRSATFNLGVLQALARLGLLRYVDYLSTVSGGGYIGGWLHAWVHRADGGIAAVEKALAPEPGEPAREPRQVGWLRQYSNYLTPRVGLLSADTMAGAATWLRNVLLNQAVLAALGLALLCLPWVVLRLLHWEPWQDQALPVAVAGLGILLVALGGAVGGRETALIESEKAFPDPQAPPPGDAVSWRRKWAWVVVAGAGLGSLLVGVALPFAAERQKALLVALWLAHAVPFSLGWMAGGGTKTRAGWVPVTAALCASPLLAGLAYGLLKVAPELAEPGSRLLLVVLGPPAALLAVLLAATGHIGLAGRRLRESSREWWSRTGGILISLLLGWLALAGVALVGAYGVIYAGAVIAALGGAAWLLTTVAGVIAGRSATTGGNAGGGWKELLAGVAPWVFVVGLLVLLSYGLHWGITRAGGTDAMEICQSNAPGPGRTPAYELTVNVPTGPAAGHTATASGQVSRVEPDPGCSLHRYAEQARVALQQPVYIWAWPLVLLVVAFGLGWRVDINVFAFHMFYRNRLERCYLGASREGPRGHPFTGLDPGDSPKLAKLRLRRQADKPAQRPYPLINAALNLARSSNLAWQERKAASFLFTPEHCGYQLGGLTGCELSAYQRTGDYVAEIKDKDAGRKGSPLGWLALGMPITASGAAASPNAGYHTNPATAFLMTVFNVRLGWWIQNTRDYRKWSRGGPPQSMWYLLQELLASTSDASSFVYVSDGGHFENLGIYELVRRRCRYIIASDAGCDPKYSFEDLGNAIRKCGTDFGIEIEIDPAAIAPDPETGRSRFHCAVGIIHYERADPVAAPGYLLYIKASLTGDEPADVEQYRSAHELFPHESTGDQWYSESQFESYRKLGWHVATEVLRQAREDAARAATGGARAAPGECPCDRELLFHMLAEQWYPPSHAVQASFAKHGKDLEEMFESLRSDPELRFLDAQIYPEWLRMTRQVPTLRHPRLRSLFPRTQEELRAAFYFCNRLIQLMENVYLDLDLEQEHGHPDNRGWMNLFRHWSWSGMLRVTWSVCAATYGARFQQFCRRHLGLEVGGIAAGKAVELGRSGWAEQVNFLEREHIQRIVAGSFARPEEPVEAMPAKEIAAIADAWLAGGQRPKLELVPVELRVQDPTGEAGQFSFPFGFALLRPGEKPEQPGQAGEAPKPPRLVYYRVRDHLRQMGLGRAGLARLREAYPELRLELPPKLEELIPEADVQLMQRLWHSVVWASGTQQPKRG